MTQSKQSILIRSTIGLLIAGVCLWAVSREVDFATLSDAIRQADAGLIGAAFAVILVTSLVKGLRWQQLFAPRSRPELRSSYRALMLGQMINLISPIPRLGDLARVVDLHQTSSTKRAESLGTLASEKAFDLLFTALTILFLLPIIVVPDAMRGPMTGVGPIALAVTVMLLLLAFCSEMMLGIFGRITRPLPARFHLPLNRLAASMLAGFSALRSPKLIAKQLLLNCLLVLLAIATPLLLFRAFALDLTVADAFLLNIAVLLGLSLPSTPARIGTFEGVVYAILAFFGVEDETLRLSYAIVFHLVIVLPPILIGSLFALTSRYNWRKLFSLASLKTERAERQQPVS